MTTGRMTSEPTSVDSTSTPSSSPDTAIGGNVDAANISRPAASDSALIRIERPDRTSVRAIAPAPGAAGPAA